MSYQDELPTPYKCIIFIKRYDLFIEKAVESFIPSHSHKEHVCDCNEKNRKPFSDFLSTRNKREREY